MQQALHIFRKDARQLRFEIGWLLFVLLVMTLAAAEPWSEFDRGRNDFPEMLSVVCALSAWFLVGRALHSEAIPGDRHFWLTRPYKRSSLIAAKALFIAAFINLPLLVAQTAILSADGLLGDSLAGLLWNQFLVTAVGILPAAAIASMTRNMVQYGLASIAAFAVVPIIFEGSDRMGAFTWVRHSVGVTGLVALATPVLAIQYLRRKRRLSATVAVIGGFALLVLFLTVPLPVALGLQTAATNPVDGFAVQMGAPTPIDPELPPWDSLVRIPYSISGLEDGAFRVDAVQETFTTPSGKEWKPRVLLPRLERIEHTAEGLMHEFYADGNFLNVWGQNTVHLRATFYVTSFGGDQVTQVPLDGTPVHIPTLGQCGNLPLWGEFRFTCRAGFRLPHAIASLSPTAATFQPELSYSPFPANISILPVVNRYDFTGHDEETGDPKKFTGKQVAITVRKAVAHFRYELDIPDFRLADYNPRRRAE